MTSCCPISMIQKQPPAKSSFMARHAAPTLQHPITGRDLKGAAAALIALGCARDFYRIGAVKIHFPRSGRLSIKPIGAKVLTYFADTRTSAEQTT